MEYVIKVPGMMCGHCVARITTALKNGGVTDVRADLESKLLTVGCPEDMTREQVKELLLDTGYEPEE